MLLRDHITLLTDIAKDWTSGPPGDYEHFVPFHYAMDVKVTDYALRLYVNDHNIINNPSMIQDNCELTRDRKRGSAGSLRFPVASFRRRERLSSCRQCWHSVAQVSNGRLRHSIPCRDEVPRDFNVFARLEHTQRILD